MTDTSSFPTIPVLYHDAHILVVSKPAGLRTIRDGYHPEYPYLSSILENAWGRIWVVHRLDKETSGVILFSLSAESHRQLNEQFRNREINKEYHTIVQGTPAWDEMAITSPLKINGDRHHRTVVDERTGKPSRTDCAVIERLEDASLLKVKPVTGYTHQIRAHLSSAGFPIIGDLLYGVPHSFGNHARFQNIPLLLHAYVLTITHPMTHLLMSFSAPYPEEFSYWVSKLNKKPGEG